MDRILRYTTRAEDGGLYNTFEPRYGFSSAFQGVPFPPPYNSIVGNETILTVDDVEDDQELKLYKAYYKGALGLKKKRKPRKAKPYSTTDGSVDGFPSIPNAQLNYRIVDNQANPYCSSGLFSDEDTPMRSGSNSTTASIARGIERLHLETNPEHNPHPTMYGMNNNIPSPGIEVAQPSHESKQEFGEPLKITFSRPIRTTLNSQAKPFICKPIPGRNAHDRQQRTSNVQHTVGPAMNRYPQTKISNSNAAFEEFKKRIEKYTKGSEPVCAEISLQAQKTSIQDKFIHEASQHNTTITPCTVKRGNTSSPGSKQTRLANSEVPSDSSSHMEHVMAQPPQSFNAMSVAREADCTPGPKRIPKSEPRTMMRLHEFDAVSDHADSQFMLQDLKALIGREERRTHPQVASDVLLQGSWDVNISHQQKSAVKSSPTIAEENLSQGTPDTPGSSDFSHSDPDHETRLAHNLGLRAQDVSATLTSLAESRERILEQEYGHASTPKGQTLTRHGANAAGYYPARTMTLKSSTLSNGISQPGSSSSSCLETLPQSRTHPIVSSSPAKFVPAEKAEQVTSMKIDRKARAGAATLYVTKTSPDLQEFKSIVSSARPLPGDALRQRKQEYLKAQASAQAEADRKRREFKAKPLRLMKASVPVPRDTTSSLLRKRLATNSSTEAPGTSRPAFLSSGNTDTTLPRTPTKSAEPAGSPRKVQSGSTPIKSQKTREHDARMSKRVDPEKEKHERELHIRTSRAEAAEKSRQAARLCALKGKKPS